MLAGAVAVQHDLVAGLEGGTRRFHHFARKVHAGHEGEILDTVADALDHHGVLVIDGGMGDANDHIAFGQRRGRHLAQPADRLAVARIQVKGTNTFR